MTMVRPAGGHLGGVTEDAAQPPELPELPEPEWLAELREDLRLAAEHEVSPPPRRVTLLDRLLG